MGTQLFEKQFNQIGARAKFLEIPAPTWQHRPGIDIGTDKFGEFFDIKIAKDDEISYEVVDLNKNLRHLLLMARRAESKEKFLCGHDERHWFVCAVPARSITNVINAMESLQPAFVRGRIRQNLRRQKNRFERRNEAFVRQGEWFFVPTFEAEINPTFTNPIHKNEPLSRGRGSKPHICQEVFRGGGTLVWVCSRHPSGITQQRYAELLKSNPNASRWNWRTFVRDAKVYARGTVRHSDHKTIVLHDWHQVFMNTENEAPGMRHVVFLD
jgi:hypothetical protein